MARRHALRLCLLVLGMGHVVVPASLIAAQGWTVRTSWPIPVLDPAALWAALVALAGGPMIALAVKPRDHSYGRGLAARIAAALVLIGAASGSAGMHLATLLGPAAFWPPPVAALPGLATAGFGLVLMPMLAARSERRGGPVTVRARLPDHGPALRLYAAVDWIVLRTTGLGLCLVAWQLHAARDAPGPLAPLLHGQAIEHAVVAYGVLGALLAAPFALPRALARPRTVLAGVAKSALIVALASTILPVLDAAAALHAPPIHREALRAAMPDLVRGVAGVMIVATIVLAFLDQIVGPVRRDGMGNPLQPLQADDLRALRASRMRG